MSSSLSDDELPPGISSSAGAGRKAERVRMVAYHNEEAPLERHEQKVLLEIMDTSPSAAERSGLDLVAVLDVSTSMGNYERIEKLKTAMKFVIGKLGPMDRLSIVSFSDKAEKRCGLLSTTRPASRQKLNDIVENGLKADGNTNMREGLETGLDVLARHRHRVGRVGSIILMSDGEQNRGGNAEDVKIVDNVAVYTFGFGAGKFAWVLETIASKSQGGTFYFVKDGERVSEHFSQVLAGLLSIVVQDLKLTVWELPGHSTIDEHAVDAGGYPPVPHVAEHRGRTWCSVTVSFGDLYSGEVRKVLVNLLLPAYIPAIDRDKYRATTVLFAKCYYSIQGKDMESPPGDDYLRCVMRRTRTAMSRDVVRPEVKAEQVRRDHAKTLWKVIQIEDMDRAKSKLEEAKRDLDAEQQQSSSSSIVTTMISILRDELNLFLRMATWAELLACLLAAWTSHNRQRFAARGDVRSVRIFVTWLMPMLMDQAIKFEANPSMQLPSVEEDMKKKKEEEARAAAMARQRPVMIPRKRWWHDDEDDSGERTRRSWSGWAWRLVLLLCTVLAIALIITGVVVLAVFLLYKPKMPRLVVSDARLVQLQYDQDGTLSYVQAIITILAENNNSKADASFNSVDLALAFHGANIALLRAAPFVVPRENFLPLRYNIIVSAGQTLDPDGMQAMDQALKDGVVPLDLFGKARTRWKVGVFVHLKFWTRLSCRLRFFFPGNGTVMTADRQKCHSRSP